jgi:hypothetical protein
MRSLIIISVVLLLAQPAFAALNKCVDDNGKFHYYDKILPSECKDKETIEMNSQGVVINKTEANTEQAPQSAEDEAAHLAAEQKREDEKRRDTVLLNTYTSIEEIELARERNLHPLTLAIIGIEKRLGIARNRLTDLQKQADVAEKSGSPTLVAINQDIIPAEKEVVNLQNALKDNQLRMENTRTKFHADKKRFLELQKQHP